jgi:hypothetical protein
MAKFAFLISFSALFFLTQCATQAEVPTYISIDTIQVATDYSLQGSKSSKVADAWIYVDNKLMGVFELPCKMPYLEDGAKNGLPSGQHVVKIGAGIKPNGISATRIQYPYYDFFLDTITVLEGQELYLKPEVRYSSFAKFAFIEDFESAGFNLVAHTGSSPIVLSNEAFEGSKSSLITLDNTHSKMDVVSSNSLDLSAAKSVFLELDYKTDVEFKVGLEGSYFVGAPQRLVSLTINPTNGKWNKIYVNLVDGINQLQANSYYLFFTADKSSTASTQTILFDNIKVVYGE